MFDYTVEMKGSVEENALKLEQSLSTEGFGVLWTFNVADKLREKGYPLQKEYKILEVCHPQEAKEVLEQNELAVYFLPCKMVVYEGNGHTKIGMIRPSAFINMLHDEALTDKAKQIENRLIKAIDNCN